MSQAVAIAPANTDFVAEQSPAEQNVRATKSRAAIALDALLNDKPHVGDAVAQYLTTLASCFDEFALQEPANGLLDGKVLASIDQFTPYLAEFRELLGALAQRDNAGDFAPSLIEFYATVLEYKRARGDAALQSVLWLDGYRYILRELFLTTVAILIRHQSFDAVAALLNARFAAADDAPGKDESFVTFDGYAKTLDEFRNRRLQMHRLSVSSDLIRERVNPAHCDFEEIMQADFLLCLRSLVCEDNFFVRWYPRSLVFAEGFATTGFDLFVTTAGANRFGPLATMLNVKDRDDLLRRFEDVREAWCLDGWELGGCPLDFRGFMGLRNPALSK